ncbi:uncharacterized protein ARMOST_11891 [Armillaria ostoyae]|uniref:Zn(2)-C6 fungal-type domain-containing protein n=1 Tax=Armillaria ostoyae TaxID=47428 RepID=A0A284RII4_ARMOS|nr:uncharacterized protein ARMOST_11891 [Armillaria ostoyae]
MVLHTIIPEIPDCGTYPRNSPTKSGLVSPSNSFLDNGPSHPLHPSSNSTQGTYKFNYGIIPSLPLWEGSEHQGVDCASSVPVANFDSGMTPFTSTTEYSMGEQCIFRPDCNESVFEHFRQNHNSMLTRTLEANSSYGTSNTFEQPMNPTAWSYPLHMTQTYLHNTDAFPSQPIASPIPSFPMFGENSYATDVHDVAAVLPVSSYSGPSCSDASYPTLNGGLLETGSKPSRKRFHNPFPCVFCQVHKAACKKLGADINCMQCSKRGLTCQYDTRRVRIPKPPLNSGAFFLMFGGNPFAKDVHNVAALPVSSYSGPVHVDSSFPTLNGSLPENQSEPKRIRNPTACVLCKKRKRACKKPSADIDCE